MKTPWSKLKTFDSIDSPIILSDNPVCKSHNKNKLRYVDWFDWAERKIKQGHVQKQCDRCGYWFFKCEY